MKSTAILILLSLFAITGCGDSDELSKAKKLNSNMQTAIKDAQYFGEMYSKSMRDDGDLELLAVAPKLETLAAKVKPELKALETDDKEDTMVTLEPKKKKMVDYAKQFRDLLYSAADVYQRRANDNARLGGMDVKDTIPHRTYQAYVDMIKKLEVVR